jgi:hypothetical protein
MIPAVTPLLLGVAGLAVFLIGGLVLRTFGPQYRIGRLLATTPKVSIAEANALSTQRRRAYVRVDGRIDAEDEFEDADHRPLVYRRVRLEARVGRRWQPFEDHRQVVPFAINEGLDSIGVDPDALADGLIVVPRESVGRAADLPDRVPERYGPDATVRARIEQLSSVEHATVVGFPVADPSAPAGAPTAWMTAGRGRPLILTVLETDEAMRLLAGGDATRTRLAAGLLGLGATIVVGAVAWAAVSALLPALITVIPPLDVLVTAARAASAAPTPAGIGDPRSNGQGPGLVGSPALAILGVVAIGVVAVVVTAVYVRLTRPATDPTRRGSTGPPGQGDGRTRTRRR